MREMKYLRPSNVESGKIGVKLRETEEILRRGEL